MKKKHNAEDELLRLQQEALEREVDEDLQRERLLALWKKYRFAIIGAVVAVLLLTICTEVYHSWRAKVSLAESDAFEDAVISSYLGDDKKAEEIYLKLADSAHTGYKSLSQLKLAAIYFSQNKNQEALNELKKVQKDADSEQLRAVATFAYVGHLVDEENPQELHALLKPFLNDKSAFYGSAAELDAALYLREGKTEEAIQVLQQAANAPLTTAVMKQDISELLSVIGK